MFIRGWAHFARSLANEWVADPKMLGLDFLLVAFCTAMGVGLIKARHDWLPLRGRGRGRGGRGPFRLEWLDDRGRRTRGSFHRVRPRERSSVTLRLELLPLFLAGQLAAFVCRAGGFWLMRSST